MSDQWTEDELRKRQEEWKAVPRHAEIYRLARLGLAAEQVGRGPLGAAETFEERVDEQHMPLLKAFLDHPAWEAR